MAQRALEQRVENLEHRVATVEQIVPTLATKADINAYVKEDGEQTRRHISLVAAGLCADLRLIAEGQTSLHASLDAMHADIMRLLGQHDKRLMRLEASQKRRSPA